MDKPGEAITTTPYDLVIILFNRQLLPSGKQRIEPSHLTSLQDALTQATGSQVTPAKYEQNETSSSSHVLVITISQISTPLATLRTHPSIQSFEREHQIELVLQDSQTFKTPLRLAVFDMDSTLIGQEVIDELAHEAGIKEKVAAITERAMRGELDFSASLRERVGLLAGLPEGVFGQLKPRITLTPGAETLLKELKRQGVKTALLSGGFVPLARWIAEKLGIDYVHANELEVGPDGRLNGKLTPGCIIVDGARKRHLLQEIAEKEGITDARGIIAVGDGANDLPMLWAAGLGVAVNAKPKVQLEAPAKLNGAFALLDVIYCTGLSLGELDNSAAS